MKAWRLLLIGFVTVIFGLFVSQFFFGTQFKFTSSPAFQGELLYNPYKSLDSTAWLKCNFHAHASAWKGVTNGHGTAKDIHHAYDSLKYAIHCVSNYHSIDTNNASQAAYLPAYEHGYNILKTHQLVLGSNKVSWLDYILPQTLSNKQDVINSLVADTQTVVILNHPSMRKGYAENDLLYLSNYHCMEVLNPAGTSFPQWDAALSAGKPVFIVGNDDLHNVLKKERLGRMCTFVNAAQTKEQVLHALKTGKGYGVNIGPGQHVDSIPALKQFELSHDTIRLVMTGPATAQINFIGQNGTVLKSLANTNAATYVIKKEDHYARAVINYPNQTSIYLNPVFYTNATTLSQSTVYPDNAGTLFHRAIGFFLAGAWIFGLSVYMQGHKPIYIKLPFLRRKNRKRLKWKKKKPAVLT